MGRVMILLLLALGVGLYFQQSRAVIFDTAQPLLRPAYVWMTNQELRQIVSDLETHQESRGGLPTDRGEFDLWLDGRYPQETSRIDAWGNRYRLTVTTSLFRVSSAGPDGTFDTTDDLIREGQRVSGVRRR
ncbi:MAG: hypothetical protein WD056_00925 [Gemmatimonadota bacterium]